MRAVLASLLGLFALVAANTVAVAAGEEILSFKSEITIHEDATVTIVETIQVRSTGNKIKRGIYRDFPTNYKDRYGNTVRVSFEVLKVVRGDSRINHWVESIASGKRVYMGSKNAFIPSGVHVFQLTYRTDQQVGFYENFDELAWNVTGDKWDFPILTASAEIHLPQGATVLEKVAYTGRYGSTEQAVLVETESPDKASFQTTRRLLPGEGLTVAVAWPKGFVAEPTKAEGVRLLLNANADLAAAVVGLFVVLAYYLVSWSFIGRDPRPGTIIPRFKSPDDMSPAVMRYIVQRKFDDTTLSAAIVSLAVKGILRIDDEDGIYKLEKTSSDYSNLSKGERGVAEKLFAGDVSSVSLHNQNQVAVGHARKKLRSMLESEIDDVYFAENRSHWLIGNILSVLVVAVILYFSNGFISGEMEWSFSVIAMIAISVVAIRIITSAGSQTQSFVETVTRLIIRVAMPVCIVIAINLVGLLTSISWPVIAIIGIIAVLSPVFGFLLKAPTIKGRNILDQIQGLKLYLTVAEKHRLEAMHPPKETPETFEKFMPYAIALDVGHIWSQRFADHLKQLETTDSQGATVPYNYRPRWYAGRHWHRGNISSLGRTLGKSFSGAVSVAATPPASTSRGSFTSGRGGFSGGGFGGGGFSGGGGGGGGGGGF